ncbi:hypothetical protein M405DRAFT_553320 [Rhizopogon salebrosus TDB-379]|nr:hypothetical protein M405DRAFT_553320 [Rhizopogon salebrosus TDB-379]
MRLLIGPSEVYNLLDGMTVNILSQYKRDESCSVADITTIVQDVANNPNVKVLSQKKKKRSGCDVVKVSALATNILNNPDIKMLSGYASIYSMVNTAVDIYNTLNSDVSQ